MLSVENPPRDPSQISQLNSSSDEKASSDKQQPHPVDLLKSDLDDHNKDIHNPTPKFSIRDYVFNTRGKDIKNSWPFSQENLQLCLKHGVTNLLPPFQSSDTLRNPSLESFQVSSFLSEKENTSNSNGEPSGQSDRVVLVDSRNAGCNPKLAEDCSNTNPSGSEGDKEFPSTITSQSCSAIDSVPTNKSPSLESETDILPEVSVAKPEVISSAENTNTQAPAKKCRLIVKLSNIANSSTKEDTAVNNFLVSEAMASKICPVCKTFSSSSNTTLNAHIDQCLSGESTTKRTTNSKVIKHRVKPRKMKSMVEIYVTAAPCTLEELDRRNGTNWATNSILPAQEVSTSVDQKKEGSSPTNLEETPDEGAVYIDANGTKVRILSKSNDPSVFSKVLNGQLLKRSINRDKVHKRLSAKKKKKQNQVQKQRKILKHGKKICPQSHHSSKVNNYQDRNFSEEEGLGKVECVRQWIKAQGEVKFSRPDMIQGWACSKRTGLTKKFNDRDDNQHSGSWDDRDLAVENNQLSLCDSRVKKSFERTEKICENSLPSPSSSKRIDISSSLEHNEDYREQLRKRPGPSSVQSHASHDRKRSKVLPRYPDNKVKQTRSNEHHNQEDLVSLLSKRKIEMSAGVGRNADHPVVDPKVSAKARRFSSLRKKLPTGRKSMPASKFNLKGKCSPSKKFRDGDKIERTCHIESVEGNGVSKIRKSGGGSMVSRKEETMALKISHSESMSYHYDAGDHDSSFKLASLTAGKCGVAESAGKDICHTHAEKFDIEPPSEVASGRTFMDFRNSLDAGFHGLAGSSDAHHDSHRFIEAYKEAPLFEAEAPTTSAEPILNGGPEMFSVAEVPEHMIREDVHVMAEPDSSDGHGNYFTEVDPIPIPGPPGSFLPSPGHMDSEDIQGNSSLTSSRVQSSDDHQELVDHSSDSPVSATSTISNSNLARSDSKSSGKLSVGHPPFLDEMRSGCISAANGDPSLENSSAALKPSDAGIQRVSLDELKVSSSITEKGAFRFSSDQPCCCSRKEGFTQNVSLRSQESQLLRRRSTAAAIVPASGKELAGDIDRSLDSLRSEISSISGLSPRPETAVRSTMGHSLSRVSADSDVKFPNRDDSEPCCPSASNPVLRLMGKNLLVVKKEESISPQIKPCQLSSMISHTNPPVVALSGVSVGNARIDNQRIGHHMVSQSPFYTDQAESRKEVMQHPEMRWSDGLGSHDNMGILHLSPLASQAALSSRGAVRGGFMGTSMHHDYMAGCHLTIEKRQPLNRLDSSIICDADKFVESSNFRWRSANTTANAIKEIIVIDDTPENEVNSTVATHSEGMIHGMGSCSGGKQIMMASACDSRHASSFHSYQQFEAAATFNESSVDASFWMPPPSPSGVDKSAVKWNWTPEGSNSLHASPLASAAQQRSKLYSSSNF